MSQMHGLSIGNGHEMEVIGECLDKDLESQLLHVRRHMIKVRDHAEETIENIDELLSNSDSELPVITDEDLAFMWTHLANHPSEYNK